MYQDDIFVFGLLDNVGMTDKCAGPLRVGVTKLKAKKCLLFQEEISFLGHIVSAKGIRADPAKCKWVNTNGS